VDQGKFTQSSSLISALLLHAQIIGFLFINQKKNNPFLLVFCTWFFIFFLLRLNTFIIFQDSNTLFRFGEVNSDALSTTNFKIFILNFGILAGLRFPFFNTK
jgi:hypothetical protein